MLMRRLDPVMHLQACQRPSAYLLCLLLSLCLMAGCGGADGPPPSADPAASRTIEQGNVVGYVHPSRAVHVWKGIPFAAPPVGDLRWRAPKPPAAWDGTFNALTSASECLQLDMPDSTKVKGSEDCLYLDVYAPRFAVDAIPQADDRRPVMVWIHGGGNSIGSAQIYDASRLVVAGDVIVVNLQYRLGVLGWFSHPALRAQSADTRDASGNYGTLDTIRALEWVQTNIAAFGGNPDNVTIFGESAGGVDVYALLLSPPAKGLFHKAIAQSGVLVSTPRADAEGFADDHPRRVPGANELLLRYLLADGTAPDRAAARTAIADMSSVEVDAYLRGKTAAELLAIFSDGAGGAMYYVPQVIRDGHVIVDMDPLAAVATPGAYNAVPTLAGTNREETKLFEMLGSDHVRRVMGIPVGIADERGFDLEGEYGGLLWKAQGSDEPLATMRASGRSDVYGYRFDWDEQGHLLWVDLSRLLGAAHAVELLFVFGFIDLGWITNVMYADLPSASRLSDQMQSYWTRFAHSGSPGRGLKGDLPEWTAWGTLPSDNKFMVLDSASGGGVRMSNAAVTVESVVAKLDGDARVADTEERCGLYRQFVRGFYVPGALDYASFQNGACLQWPIEQPPLSGEGVE